MGLLFPIVSLEGLLQKGKQNRPFHNRHMKGDKIIAWSYEPTVLKRQIMRSKGGIPAMAQDDNASLRPDTRTHAYILLWHSSSHFSLILSGQMARATAGVFLNIIQKIFSSSRFLISSSALVKPLLECYIWDSMHLHLKIFGQTSWCMFRGGQSSE